MTSSEDIKYLYKYYDLKKENIAFIERIFTHSEIFFSKPVDFNDPFDCRPKFSLTATDRELKKYLQDRFPKILPHFNREQRKTKIRDIIKNKKMRSSGMLDHLDSSNKKRMLEEVAVCCFSQIPHHILMWSHYSNGHTGICLEFEATSYTEFFGSAQQVHYQIEFPIVNPIKDTPAEMLQSTLLTKAKYWEYEQEWRIAFPDEPSGIYTFPKKLLTGVILGAQISLANKKKVINWVNNMETKPKIYQASLKEYEYGVDITELNDK